eukprot:768361-Prymnesium_polylepis.1
MAITGAVPPSAQTPSLGRVVGVTVEGVDAFLGLKYAEAARFAPAVPFVLSAARYDATSAGP